MSLYPKVLVFSCTYDGKDYCFEQFKAHATKLVSQYPNAHHIIIDNSISPEYYNTVLKGCGIEAHRVLRGNNSRESLARAQNYARKYAIENNYDYLLSLESDVFPPENFIAKLISHTKQVVTGLYLIGKEVKVPCVTLSYFNELIRANGSRLLKPEEFGDFINKGLKEVQAGGMGCCLISRDVFTKLAFTYDPRFMGHSDIYFFNDVRSLGIKTFVDTDMFCQHIQSDWDMVKDR